MVHTCWTLILFLNSCHIPCRHLFLEQVFFINNGCSCFAFCFHFIHFTTGPLSFLLAFFRNCILLFHLAGLYLNRGFPFQGWIHPFSVYQFIFLLKVLLAMICCIMGMFCSSSFNCFYLSFKLTLSWHLPLLAASFGLSILAMPWFP